MAGDKLTERQLLRDSFRDLKGILGDLGKEVPALDDSKLTERQLLRETYKGLAIILNELKKNTSEVTESASEAKQAAELAAAAASAAAAAASNAIQAALDLKAPIDSPVLTTSLEVQGPIFASGPGGEVRVLSKDGANGFRCFSNSAQHFRIHNSSNSQDVLAYDNGVWTFPNSTVNLPA